MIRPPPPAAGCRVLDLFHLQSYTQPSGRQMGPPRNPLRARPSRCGPPRRESLCASLPRAGLLRSKSKPPGDSPTDLCRASVSSDRSMLPFMERHLHDLVRESREPETFSRQVNHLIARRIGHGPISLPAIAAELGLPPRSFQRRLAEERTSLRRLVRDQRRSIAESLIKNRATTVTSVAHTVGYAETAVLSELSKAGPAPHREPTPDQPKQHFEDHTDGKGTGRVPQVRKHTWEKKTGRSPTERTP